MPQEWNSKKQQDECNNTSKITTLRVKPAKSVKEFSQPPTSRENCSLSGPSESDSSDVEEETVSLEVLS